MTTQFNYLAFDQIRNAKIEETPYPYTVIQHSIRAEKVMPVCETFPNIMQRGSFPLSQVSYDGEFANLIKELESPELRACIAEKFKLNLSDKPPMITLRGFATERDGHIHTDSKSKVITVLMYFNPTWDSSGGCLRLLNSNVMDDVKTEVPPLAGTCIIFKVTDNCWHGHLPFVGVRRSIQLNYVANESAVSRNLFRHRLSAKLKSIKKLFG